MVKKKGTQKKSVFAQAMAKGSKFSFVFFLFFMMCGLPIVLMFFSSLFTSPPYLPGIFISVVFIAILARHIKKKELHRLCRSLTLLNVIIWFLLGFFPLYLQLTTDLSGILRYLLLLPYAIISGYLVYYLLSRTAKDNKQLLRGAVLVSSLISFTSAVNGAVVEAGKYLTENIDVLAPAGEKGELVLAVLDTLHLESINTHISFLLVLFIFNLPFLLYFWRKNLFEKKTFRTQFLWYALPLLVYVLLVFVFTGIKNALF